jgi:dTDP-4-dehydrorhamnose reductase
VINAIGLIKQKSTDHLQLFLMNSVFPQHLAHSLGPQQRLIHASTDCVFSGKTGGYASQATKDADDVYGLSKVFGESIADHQQVLVMRVSVIGPELSGTSGLFSWFMGLTQTVNGYTNHRWNGITTLEWAKAAADVISGDAPIGRGLVQLGVHSPVSKYELLCMIRDVFEKRIEVSPTACPEGIDRTLLPEWERTPLENQLRELKSWLDSGSHTTMS